MRKEGSVQNDVVLAPYRCAGRDYVMLEHSCHVPIKSSSGSFPPPALITLLQFESGSLGFKSRAVP
jgi:hypothetical protein